MRVQSLATVGRNADRRTSACVQASRGSSHCAVTYRTDKNAVNVDCYLGFLLPVGKPVFRLVAGRF